MWCPYAWIKIKEVDFFIMIHALYYKGLNKIKNPLGGIKDEN